MLHFNQSDVKHFEIALFQLPSLKCMK